jgi:hypothetical protein
MQLRGPISRMMPEQTPYRSRSWCASTKIEDLGRSRRRRIISLRNINFVGINHDQFERLFRVNHRHVSVLKSVTPSIAFVSAIGPQIESVEMHSIDGFALRCFIFMYFADV